MPECGGAYGNIFRRAADYGPKHSEVYGRSDAGGDKQPEAGDKQPETGDKQPEAGDRQSETEIGAERQPAE